jgi:hypothetical protein
MIKCPFCHFNNEDGALFCEQCKSDLAGIEAIPTAEPVEAVPVAAGEIVETVPVAAGEIVETVPVVAMPEGAPVIEALLAEPVISLPPGTEAVPVATLAPESPGAGIVAEAYVSTTPHTMPETPLAAPLAPAIPAAPAAPAAPTPAAAPPPPAAPAAAPAPPITVLPPGAQPRLLVLRGLKRGVEYPLYEGHNFIGRADEKPVDIDLEDQEPPDRIWSSRQHALVSFDGGRLFIEDLNSSNGTFVNRTRVYPGQKRDLAVNDVIQIGTVQMKVII